jgi:L-ascorbate metabolism protein UlaG (beta-lactamase superfamily)
MRRPSRRVLTFSALASLLLLAGLGVASARPGEKNARGVRLWVRQLGTGSADIAFGVSADGRGSVYVAGSTEGSLDAVNAGDADAFVSRFGSDGRRLWTRQLGTKARDAAFAVAADHDRAVYIAGLTFGGLDGSNAGAYDAFVTKYSPRGDLLWVRQLGTAAGEFAGGVAVDEQGNVYIGGDSHGDLGGKNLGDADAYIAKYSPDGRRLWTRKLGSRAGDVVKGICTDNHGRVYVAGQTDGDFGTASHGRTGAFVAAYTTGGRRLWTRQFGSAALDYANAVATDGRGAIYVAGLTNGALYGANAGHSDAFLARYDSKGRPVWMRQLGTASDEQANGVAVDGAGAVYIAGNTRGNLGGTAVGAVDAFLAKYSASGTLRWTQLLGTRTLDIARGISVDPSGAAYIAGQTAGRFGGSSAGGIDAYLAKYK